MTIRIQEQSPGRRKQELRVLIDGALVHADCVNLGSDLSRMRFLRAIMRKISEPDRESVYATVEAELLRLLAVSGPPTTTPTPSLGDTDASIRIIKEFLRESGADRISTEGLLHFTQGNVYRKHSECFAVPGAQELVKNLPEYHAQATQKLVRPLTLIALTRDMCKIAALQLRAELPVEQPQDTSDGTEAIRDEIIEFLIRPQNFYDKNGICVNSSYALFTLGLPPSDAWLPVYNHAVYGRACLNGDFFVGVKSQFLIARCRNLRKRYATAQRASGFLLNAGIVSPRPGGGASHSLKVSGRVIRAWVLAADILLDAGGSVHPPTGTQLNDSLEDGAEVRERDL